MSAGPKNNWRPSANHQVLRIRARCLRQIREFFAHRMVLEVETPLLSRAGTTDPYLHSLSTELHDPGNDKSTTYYLQTSPEFAMKRLLAAGSGPIYQITRVFRDGESGRLHNPEFTMIEWYRLGYSMNQLMNEVEDLVRRVLQRFTAKRLTYSEAFMLHADFNPHKATLEELQQHAARLQIEYSPMACRYNDDYLNLILSHHVAPALQQPTFLYDFPASQAALAKVRNSHPPIAERFELFINGIEIANGFCELTDALEQRQRFELELQRRRELALPEIPIDEWLLEALEHGMPASAGVALGFDRLVMIATEAKHINEVLAFPLDWI